MKIILDCNCKCWECSRKDCNMTQFFYYPERIFYDFILEALKSPAGMLINSGYSKQKADEYIEKRAVALKIAREQYLKKYSKN